MSRHNRSRPEIDILDGGDFAAVVLVVTATFAVLMATMGIGVPRDESFYFKAGFEYLGWFEELWQNARHGRLFETFTQAAVDRHFSYNAEHPALMKALFGLSYKLFTQKLGWLESIEAMRVPAVAFASALSGFVYLFARQLFGRAAGFLAVAFLLLQPRYFFHAHLACFDVPVIAAWVAVVYAYWRSFDSVRWGVLTGVFWGIALSIKLNAFFLPGVLGAHWVWVMARRFRATGQRPPVPWAFVWMALVGPILFFGLWPRHWFDTVKRVEWYLNFHLTHVHYFVYYFGQNIQQPPFPISYPWVMTALTVPATILLAFVAGVATFRSRVSRFVDDRETAVLLAINILFPIALISLPGTPIFGGTKHWMAAMPFLSIVAGGGVVACAGAAATAVVRRWDVAALGAGVLTTTIVGAAVALPAFTMSVENHPLGTTYYNELIGSYRGAADARMMRKFWGYSSRYALDWLNENAPKGARVWTHNTTTWAWQAYQRDGLVRSDLRPAPTTSSDYALYHHQKAFVYMLTELWDSYGTKTPSHVVDVDGVPVLSVYVRPSRGSDR